jgi:hypothetical protein
MNAWTKHWLDRGAIAALVAWAAATIASRCAWRPPPAYATMHQVSCACGIYCADITPACENGTPCMLDDRANPVVWATHGLLCPQADIDQYGLCMIQFPDLNTPGPDYVWRSVFAPTCTMDGAPIAVPPLWQPKPW